MPERDLNSRAYYEIFEDYGNALLVLLNKPEKSIFDIVAYIKDHKISPEVVEGKAAFLESNGNPEGAERLRDAAERVAESE